MWDTVPARVHYLHVYTSMPLCPGSVYFKSVDSGNMYTQWVHVLKVVHFSSSLDETLTDLLKQTKRTETQHLSPTLKVTVRLCTCYT